ncbi:hypothetical protein ASNO1_03430 [Corallococcus caeni]|uniref:Uncharacterized protein n=1 Tax=Corallococcus caeni TaxID=3082388 RepID=A0ABQ6QJ70_9BACT|nr:hypothetical protein ASNO1_03430 [Corallococcus sp. NO1]
MTSGSTREADTRTPATGPFASRTTPVMRGPPVGLDEVWPALKRAKNPEARVELWDAGPEAPSFPCKAKKAPSSSPAMTATPAARFPLRMRRVSRGARAQDSR